MREEKLSGPSYLAYVRGDVGIGYLFTALFGIAMMLIANQTFFVSGIKISDAQVVPMMAAMLGEKLGPFGVHAFSLGFWAAVFSAVLGVWQSIPYLFADFYAILAKVSGTKRAELTKVTSTPYRLALLFVTLAPIPFTFTGRPLFIIVAYTTIASLFIPFLAATLLYLNNRVRWLSPVPQNHWTTNVVLVLIVGLFLVVGVQELSNVIEPATSAPALPTASSHK
jgi:Mn2+/Fe2+ NRAMP family transporter